MTPPTKTGPCPHCAVAAHWNWSSSHFWAASPDGYDWTLCAAACPNCEKLVAKLLYFADPQSARMIPSPHAPPPPPPNAVLVWPTHPTPELDPAVPEPFAGDYRKAVAVLSVSSKASAALARRVLQALIRQKAGITRKTLDLEIDEFLKTATDLPSYVREALDHIRITGNDAAHPHTDTAGLIIDVTDDEADWNLKALLDLFDYYFVAPAKSAQRTAALQAKQQAAGKTPKMRS